MWIKYRIRKRGGWSNYTYVLESIKAAEFVAFMKEEHMYDDNFFDIEAEDVEHPPKAWITYRDWETDRKSTRLNSSHSGESRMPSSA